MSIIFGGKLLNPAPHGVTDCSDPFDERHDPKHRRHALRTLSKQEKLLLVELQKTRTNIVNELSKVDPAACGNVDNWLAVHQTMEAYKSKMYDDSRGFTAAGGSRRPPSQSAKGRRIAAAMTGSSALHDHAVDGPAATIKLSTYKTAVDMLPIMATTADPALEVGLKQQGKLRLPVFSLPALPKDGYKRRKNEHGDVQYVKLDPSEVRRGSSVRVANRGVVYRVRADFLRAVAHMHKKLSPGEHTWVKSHLGVSDRDVANVEADLLLELLLDEQAKEQERQRLADRLQGMYGFSDSASSPSGGAGGRPTRGPPPRDASAAASGRAVMSVFVKVAHVEALRTRMEPSASLSATVPPVGPLLPDPIPDARPPGTTSSTVRFGPDVAAPASGPAPRPQSAVLQSLRAMQMQPSVMAQQLRATRPASSTLARVDVYDDSLHAGAKPPRQRRTTISAPPTRPGSAAHHAALRDAYGVKTTKGDKRTAWGSGQENVHPQEAAAAAHARAQSAALKVGLLQTLGSMQHHTERVKDHILSVKDVVDVRNPKAKRYVMGMAAERLSRALWACVRRELRRGWRAWWLAVRQEERKVVVDTYVRFHGMRYLATALRWLLHAAILKKWTKWVAFANTESHRIRTAREAVAATRIQTRVLGCVTRMRVQAYRKRLKYERLYNATILLQRVFRMLPPRWRYVAWKHAERLRKAATKIQAQMRRCLAVKRVNGIRLMLDCTYAATKINSIVRMYNARALADRIRLHNLHIRCSIHIQRIARGYLARCRVAKILFHLEQFYAARLLQTRVRIMLAKAFLIKKRIETHAYWRLMAHSAVLIQKTYRGYRGRLVYKLFSLEVTRKRRRAWAAATKITNMCRCYVARQKLARLKADHFNQMVLKARMWKEMWSEDANEYFYYQAETEESIWEPLPTGYTRHDGRLILQSGECVIDPEVLALMQDTSEKMPKEMCAECNERFAIKHCNECKDNFCTPCYRDTHATGTRKKHTTTPLGPVDCGECENVLAERWCVTCDEAHCDGCWRKLHGRGKRRFHPFCKVWPGGKIGEAVTTIDGRVVSDADRVDPAFLQRRMDQEAAGEAPAGEFHYEYPTDDGPQLQLDWPADAAAAAGADHPGAETAVVPYDEAQWDAAQTEQEWQTAYDEEGNVYYYSEKTGVSQYENPYSLVAAQDQDPAAEQMRNMLLQWAQAYDAEGNPYWYNAATGQSQYESPFDDLDLSGKEAEGEADDGAVEEY